MLKEFRFDKLKAVQKIKLKCIYYGTMLELVSRIIEVTRKFYKAKTKGKTLKIEVK